ncbi:hypothetical protein EIN_371780 [Entamoeba invadens IP1]|uniref:Uncharacterized protein n=1 Tax=Entamoeba invadens IP1 TaxID=370355 RepID=A0A0A1UC12_ENTIV|nr:hypothetical protein EIN_371780 [Entamoeba invadens IP1]ELP92766.1 hypothetical protein EIN_371780 [Entamoeba invadens IP1]|eukprot:XP_004259537.1 hypothetical protein EIN_371780 [Entamoeba invadens IP1]
MANRSIYSVAKKTDTSIAATRVDDGDAFDAFDDFDNIEEPVPEVPKPVEVKEEEIQPEVSQKEEVVQEKEEPKIEEKTTNKPGWCFDDFDGAGTIKPKIYASAAGGSNVSVKKPQKARPKETASSSSNVDWNKYKNAKSISSDQLFGSDEPTEFEKAKLSQYQNSSAIGSDDFFGKKEEERTYKVKGDDDDWGNDDLAKVANTLAEGASRLATKAKNLFDDF